MPKWCVPMVLVAIRLVLREGHLWGQKDMSIPVLGPIGLLAALALRLRGAEVYGLDIVDANSARPQWLEAIGGQYVDGCQVPADAEPASGERDRSRERVDGGLTP
jgi:threonine dehydrogenase-like Zn-dependent dehydrogenase